jgi:spore photoproduct lyase
MASEIRPAPEAALTLEPVRPDGDVPTAPPASKALAALADGLWERLTPADRELAFRMERDFAFSFQQLKRLGEWLLDSAVWGETAFRASLDADLAAPTPGHPRQQGEFLFRRWQKGYDDLAARAKVYPVDAPKEKLPAHRFVDKELKGRIFRLCPAASERAVCCNLKVLNIVDNCAMACSYCVLQNHYDEAVVAVPTNLKAKLAEVELNPAKRYRIGTGEYSDSLLWGNKNGILQDLCDFARAHPNAILELKTKSANVAWILENEIPANVCCAWSLNPQVIVANEEHKTASLDRRLEAARAVADKGVKVAFHFHPMMYFEGWEEEYRALIARVVATFRPEEVLWISLGCVTLLKGFARDFRLKYKHSKLLQMEIETTPDGKLTYAFAVREKLYRNALDALTPWRDRVFQYLCMEHKPMWDAVMGFAYGSMGEFDDAFNASAFAKLTNG